MRVKGHTQQRDVILGMKNPFLVIFVLYVHFILKNKKKKIDNFAIEIFPVNHH